MQRHEQIIHRAVIEHLRQRGAPGILFWHTPQGAKYGGKKNGVIQGAIMKSLGALAGVSDILALHNGRFFALELKAPKQRPTEAQLEFLANVRDNGGFTCVAQGLDQAMSALEMWGLLRVRGAAGA